MTRSYRSEISRTLAWRLSGRCVEGTLRKKINRRRQQLVDWSGWVPISMKDVQLSRAGSPGQSLEIKGTKGLCKCLIDTYSPQHRCKTRVGLLLLQGT